MLQVKTSFTITSCFKSAQDVKIKKKITGESLKTKNFVAFMFQAMNAMTCLRLDFGKRLRLKIANRTKLGLSFI